MDKNTRNMKLPARKRRRIVGTRRMLCLITTYAVTYYWEPDRRSTWCNLYRRQPETHLHTRLGMISGHECCKGGGRRGLSPRSTSGNWLTDVLDINDMWSVLGMLLQKDGLALWDWYWTTFTREKRSWARWQGLSRFFGEPQSQMISWSNRCVP